MNILEGTNEINEQLWERFIYEHPNGNVFHTPQMFQVYENTRRYKPIILALEKEGKIKGILVAVIEKVLNGILGEYSARSIIRGGPLVENNDNELCGLLLENYNELVKKHAILSQVRNFHDTLNYEFIFKENGFYFLDHLNIFINLDVSKDKLWESLQSKSRNKIRKARKLNVEVEIDTTNEGLAESYNILKEVYHKAKLPLPDISFFQNMISHFSKNPAIKIFVAKFNNEIIACRIALLYKSVVYDFFAGAKSKHKNKCPNDLLPWEIFMWAKDNGYTLFDFGGAGSPNVPYGVRDYKMKFGGELVRYGRYEKIHKPTLFSIAKRAFLIWQKLRFTS